MKINKLKPYLSGSIIAKPSKSYEQRILAGALLSKKTCSVYNYGNSHDVIAARSIINILGAKSVVENNVLKIIPHNTLNHDELNCNESALCARLFASIACVFKNQFVITGEKSLLSRPVAEGFEIFEKMGSELEYNGRNLPVSFKNAKLTSGVYIIDGSKTSQLISGLIMSLSVKEGKSRLLIKSPSSVYYILMTIKILEYFNIKVNYQFTANCDLLIDIVGEQNYSGGEFHVEADWSGASFILTAGALCGNVSVSGLNSESIQSDKKILQGFDLANVNYYWTEDVLNVKKSDIKAFDFDACNCPDLIPSLVVLALFANGKSKISGAKRLSYKESSRGEVLCKELKKIGADIKLNGDVIEIKGKQNYRHAKLDSHNDHRMAMAFAVTGLNLEKGIEIDNMECVSKSYPEFIEDIKKIGANITL